MRITGVIIRAKVDGKWGNYDLGDPKLSNQQITDWVDEQALHQGTWPNFYKTLILRLLNREPGE